jgi:hypothetical protein
MAHESETGQRKATTDVGAPQLDASAREDATGSTAGGGFTSKGAIPPVQSEFGTAGPSASDRAFGNVLRTGETSQAQGQDETKAPTPISPAGHTSREIKVEFGEGTVTGGITLTLEFGQTGIPAGDKIKALENTASLQLNGLKTRIETAILNGELDGEVFEGLKISIEANAIKAGVDSDGEAEVDLATITVKLLGDGSKLLSLPPGATVTLEGNLSFALGGKLLAQLSSYTVAQLEQQMIAKEMGELGDELDKSAKKIKDLDAKADLLESQGKHSAAKELRDEALEHRLKSSTATQQLKSHASKLKAAKAKADKAIGKLRGKLAKQVAKAMEKKAVKFIATKLMKLVPILNVISTIIDVIELVGVIKNLIDGNYGGSGGDDDDKQDKDKDKQDGGGDGKPGVQQGEGSGKGTQEPSGTGREGDGGDAKQQSAIETARTSLSPAARAVVDSITGTGAGAGLTADQIRALGMVVPEDLTADELTEIITQLRSSGSKARTAEDVFDAVTKAVHAIRNRNATVKVNGQVQTNLGGGSDGKEQEQKPSSGDGPITSPDQVEGPSRPMEVVRGGDPATIGRWFRRAGDELIWSAEGMAWKSEHLNSELAPGTTLDVVETDMTSAGKGTWGLAVTFVLLGAGGQRTRVPHRFHVYVGGEDNGFGAKVGELKFEGYVIVGG